MNVSFTKGNSPATDVDSKVVESTATEPATITPPVKVNSNGFPLGDDLPGFKDVMFPRINISQNIGELRKTFAPGSIVFGQSTVLFSPPVIDGKTKEVKIPASPPVNITVIGIISKRFSEMIIGGVGGMIVNTEDEVRANGGTLDYKEFKLKEKEGMRRFTPLIDMLVAIKRPAHVADDDTIFNFVVGPDKYAIGLWAVKSTTYTNAFKKVLAFHRLAGVLKQGYPAHNFALSCRAESYGSGNEAWVPILIPVAKSSPEFLEFVKQIVNPAA